VDGKLDEPQWAQAALLTGFSQFSPNDGVAADDSPKSSSGTRPRHSLRHPRLRTTRRAARHARDRDKIDADDNVQILLGTFNDGRQSTCSPSSARRAG